MKKRLRIFGILILLLLLSVGCSTKDDEVVQADDQENDTEVEDEDTNVTEEEASEEDSAEDDATDENKDYGALKEFSSDFDKTQDEDETPDEDLKMSEILGTANAINDGIVYDDDQGYNILDLQVGLTNYASDQNLKNKWMAFAIPNGVSVPDVDEIPSGVVVVSLPDGHSGIAIKVPNLNGISDETDYLEIPLIGEPDDNDPNDNLYLFNVDGNEGTAELIGEISSTRDIDFSLME